MISISRACASFASASSDSRIFRASPTICRSRSATCAFSSFIFGCCGSSVALSWAICERSATCCSISRWISGELSTSVRLGTLFDCRPSRICDALASASARGGADLGQFGVEVGELLLRQRRRRRAAGVEEIVLGAERLNLGFRRLHLGAEVNDLVGEPLRRVGGGGAFRRALEREVLLGDGVGRVGRELRIGRRKIDGDDARILDREDRQLVVVGAKDAVLD